MSQIHHNSFTFFLIFLPNCGRLELDELEIQLLDFRL